MAIAPLTLEVDADSSVELNQRLTRGGVAAALLTKGIPGTWWVAPRDNRRRYISFSLPAGLTEIVLTPDVGNAPAGFVLRSSDPALEFGGKTLAALIECEWLVTTTAATEFHVVVVRD